MMLNRPYDVEQKRALGRRICDTKDWHFNEDDIFCMFDIYTDHTGDGPRLNQLAKDSGGHIKGSDSMRGMGYLMYSKQAYNWWEELQEPTFEWVGLLLKEVMYE